MRTLLRLLEDGEFHSGEALGVALGVSRAAVWKKLQQLEAELGIELHRVRGKGYRLAGPICLLDTVQISDLLRPLLWSVHVHQSLDSTNAEAIRLINERAALPLVVLAEQQTAGRGRRGRTWISPFGENLYYSLGLRIDGGMRQLEGLSLLVGLAVIKTLRNAGISEAGLKWPNDILVGRQKLAGILLEITGDPADVCHVIIGIGININMRTSSSVDQSWTSMRLEKGHLFDRNLIVTSLSKHLAEYLAEHRKDGFARFRKEWEANHLWQGCEVALLAGSSAVQGIVLGVDAAGGLRLSVGDVEQVFSGGELSLRLFEDVPS
ncbi:bifunctional biotin--[acetyl-CoA-carboxylase] ligase/biotin operon repressor BirA [Pseudomonas huanghezhanensis]|uniref:bifunctional biotin--[acetyl-CoA-carboxylase] ligase/biotin operon repressor BirA n=1 Tax=Pseudomonas huanghezhanensis TaxID=3002903 RepID=UPI0022857D60|nr:bifunctional biotin--[acetyl-CoA-carboxylase] ligase/biotin operon repressor BirA [Pseudomonas sp. BSw22131]